ncbi:MAG TPA: hypothetical protein EYG51_15115 [Pseudomonadales bacterium]|nr:hypothetical protein [Pseudomonadales bacterium]
MNFSAGSLNSKTPNYRPRYDARKGLGYGILEPVYDVPKPPIDQVGDSRFPYREPDPYSDLPEDELDPLELDAFVAKINQGYHALDPYYAGASTDPFARVSGNQPLGEAMAINPKSASPLLGMYKGMTGYGTGGFGAGLPYPGPTVGFRTHGVATGSNQGYASAPPLSVVAADELGHPIDNLEDIPDSEERTLRRLRDVIALIHREEKNASSNLAA